MTDSISGDSIAQDQLRAFIERIERIEEEVHDANADKSEIYKEARGVGFDVKVIRKIIAIRKQDHAERMEQEALIDLYMSALGMRDAPREEYEVGTVVATGARTSHQESDLAETRPDGRGKAESASGEAPDTAPQSSEAIVRQMRDEEWPDRQRQPDATPAGAVVADTSGVTAGETAPNSVLTFAPRVFRPNCLHPEACAGLGNRHCYTCTRVAENAA